MTRTLGWLRAGIALLRHVRSPLPLLALACGRPSVVSFRDGGAIEMSHPLDALLWKEIWLDDEYGLAGLDDPRCILDVGAGIGLFSLAVARRHPACRVLAFEPDPRQQPRLRRNLCRAGAAGVEVRPVAVGRAGSRRLHLAPAPPRTGRRGPGAPVDVPALPLARSVEGPVDLLKIDCEGDELEVLHTLDAHAWRQIGGVVVELHEDLEPGVGGRVEALLRDRGFDVRRTRARRGLALLRAERHRPIA